MKLLAEAVQADTLIRKLGDGPKDRDGRVCFYRIGEADRGGHLQEVFPKGDVTGSSIDEADPLSLHGKTLTLEDGETSLKIRSSGNSGSISKITNDPSSVVGYKAETLELRPDGSYRTWSNQDPAPTLITLPDYYEPEVPMIVSTLDFDDGQKASLETNSSGPTLETFLKDLAQEERSVLNLKPET